LIGYQIFIYKNTCRYIDVLPKFVRAYNDTVHSTTGMALSRVTDSDVLAIWKRMSRRRFHVDKVKYTVRQHVRNSKEMEKIAKGGEQNFSTEIFRITKVIEGRPRPVYELEDLNKTPKKGQFYGERLTPIRISKQTNYKINKILIKRVRRFIKDYLVCWRGYSK